MNADFSRLAAAVLASPYFSFSGYKGSTEDRDAVVHYHKSRWAENKALFDGVKAHGVESANDLDSKVRAIWDKAYSAMMAEGHIKQQEGEEDDAYDYRARMSEPISGRLVPANRGPDDVEDDEDDEE